MYGKYVEMYVPLPGVIFMLTKYEHEGVRVFPLSTEYESDIIPTSDLRTAVKFVSLTHHESVTRRRYDNRQTDERTGRSHDQTSDQTFQIGFISVLTSLLNGP